MVALPKPALLLQEIAVSAEVREISELSSGGTPPCEHRARVTSRSQLRLDATEHDIGATEFDILLVFSFLIPGFMYSMYH